MKVKKSSFWFGLVKDKRSMKYSSDPNHTAMNFIANVFHTIWLYGFWPIVVLSVVVVAILKKMLIIDDATVILVCFASVGVYCILFFVVAILLFVIEPFTKKEWRKLKVV